MSKAEFYSVLHFFMQPIVIIDEYADLLFDNGFRFIVDLRDEAYSGDPEAMCLNGPNNLIVVWD